MHIHPTSGRLNKLFGKLDLSGAQAGTDKEKQEIRDLLTEYHDLELDKTSLVKHSIKLTNETLFKERYCRIPPHQYKEFKKHLKEMMAIGAIGKSASPWASTVVLVRKKDGSLRFCIDLRKLNARTIRDTYSPPCIEESLDWLRGAQIFTSLDLKSGYWQIEFSEESIPLTTFNVGVGTLQVCEYAVWSHKCTCNFSVTNGILSWRYALRLVHHLLRQYHNFFTNSSRTYSRLRGILKKLWVAGLKLKPSKCEFIQSQISYLGHIVSEEGIETDPKKLSAIHDWPQT